jgi:hypothetical protein
MLRRESAIGRAEGPSGALLALHPGLMDARDPSMGHVSNGSFASVPVCPLSERCGHEFLRQGRDGPKTDMPPRNCLVVSLKGSGLSIALKGRSRSCTELLLMKEWSHSQYVKSLGNSLVHHFFSSPYELFGFGLLRPFCHHSRPKQGAPMLRFRSDRADASSKCPIFGTRYRT